MVPPFVRKFLTNFFLFLVVAFIVLVGYMVWDRSGEPDDPPSAPTATQGINETAITGWTPTQGVTNPQNATAVVLAKPTPYTTWTVADAQAFIDVMRDKAVVNAVDINTVAELSGPGAGWVCVPAQTKLFSIEVDEYCSIHLTWAEWQLNYKPQDIEIIVEQGSPEAYPPLSPDGTYYDGKYMAKVTIVIHDIGLTGPIERFDQEFDFVQDISAFWNLVNDLSELFWNTDGELKNRILQATSDADDLAKADSLAPLRPDGSRSSINTDRLYATMKVSLTTFGEGHVYNRLFEYANLIANDRRNGYAGLESFTVIIPDKPATPCDYVYAQDMTTQVIPARFCEHTLPDLAELSEQAKAEMALKVVEAQSFDMKDKKLDMDYQEMLKKIEQIP